MRARRLAQAIAETEGLDIDPREIETNVVIGSVREGERVHDFVRAVRDREVLIAAFGGPGRFRAVTHLDVDDAGLKRAVDAIRWAARSVLA